jgi:hypothetical protein
MSQKVGIPRRGSGNLGIAADRLRISIPDNGSRLSYCPTTVLQYPPLFCPSIRPLSALPEPAHRQEGLDAQCLTRSACRPAPGLRQRPAGRNFMFAVSLALIGVLGIFIVRRRSARKKQGLA